MIILKIILWIFVILAILCLLAILMITLALSTKVQVGFDYDESGTKLKLKYGFLTILDSTKKKDPAKSKKMLKKMQYHAEPYARSIGKKAKAAAQTTMEKKSVENEIKTAEDISLEQDRIASEEARLNAEMKKAKEDVATALKAEEAGTPLPEVVDESKVSKLGQMKAKLESMDIEGTYNTARAYIDAFDVKSITALLSFIGKQTGATLKKVGKRVQIKDLTISLSVRGKDAAQTALKCGAIGHIGYPALDKMCSVMNVKNCDLTVTPDFLANQDKGECHITVAVRPLRVMAPFMPYLLKVGKESMSVVSDTSSRISENKKNLAKETSEKSKQQAYKEATASLQN